MELIKAQFESRILWKSCHMWSHCDRFQNYQLHTEPAYFIHSYFFQNILHSCLLSYYQIRHVTSYYWLDDSPITREVLAHFDCCKRSLVKVIGTLGRVFLAQQPPQSIFDPSSGVVSAGTRSRGSRRTARWRWGTCRSRGSRRARWACPPAPGWRRLVLQLTSSPLFPNGRQRAWRMSS